MLSQLGGMAMPPSSPTSGNAAMSYLIPPESPSPSPESPSPSPSPSPELLLDSPSGPSVPRLEMPDVSEVEPSSAFSAGWQATSHDAQARYDSQIERCIGNHDPRPRPGSQAARLLNQELAHQAAVLVIDHVAMVHVGIRV